MPIFFFSPILSESFGFFEPLNASLTGPNRLVDKRAGVIIKTTVIEPQLVTAPPACFLLGPGNQNTAALCLGFVSAAHRLRKLAVRVSWMQQDFLPQPLLRLASPHIFVVPKSGLKLLYFKFGIFHKRIATTVIFKHQQIENMLLKLFFFPTFSS